MNEYLAIENTETKCSCRSVGGLNSLYNDVNFCASNKLCVFDVLLLTSGTKTNKRAE